MAEMTVKSLNATNAEIMDTIRANSSGEYHDRIPSSDQGDIRASIAALNEYQPQMNEFVDTLVNRIGLVEIKSKVWTSPLAGLKQGLLGYGDTVEELATTLIRARRYDPNTCYQDVFKCSPPDVRSNFHTINRQDTYDLTINDVMLRRAFTNERGLSQLVSSIMQTPYTSDHWDEYLITKNLFAEYEQADGFYKVKVPDATSASTHAEKVEMALQISEQVRAFADKLKFLKTDYNPEHVPTFTMPEQLYFFTTPEFKAMLDVNVLTFALNASKGDIDLRVIEIDDFNINGCQAILADEDLLKIYDTYINFESIRNPKGRSWNYFYHHDGIYSVSRFVNAIMFTSLSAAELVTPVITIDAVTLAFAEEDGVTPTSAPKGKRTRLTHAVTGTVTPEGATAPIPQGVTYAITALTGAARPKNGTYVDADGVLHVDADEVATDVTVMCTTTYLDPSKPISEQAGKTATLLVPITD